MSLLDRRLLIVCLKMETNNLLSFPGITYTRTGAATAWRKDGTLAEFAPNVPRITDAGVTIERQRTNLFLNSAWEGGATLTGWSNSAASSDAASTTLSTVRARDFVASASRPYMSATGTSLAASTTYTLSVVVEAISTGIPALQVLGVGQAFSGSVVLSYPACPANPAGGGAGVVGVGRLVVLISVGATGGDVQPRVGLGVSSGMTGTARLSLPQLELGTRASTPIITTGAAATRGADVLSLGGLATTLAAPWTVVCEIEDMLPESERYLFSVTGGASTANMVSMSRTSPTNLTLSIRSGGANVGSNTYSRPSGGRLRGAICWDGTSFRWATEGVVRTPVTPSAGFSTPLDRINLGYGQYSNGYAESPIRSCVLFPFALTDAELVELTR